MQTTGWVWGLEAEPTCAHFKACCSSCPHHLPGIFPSKSFLLPLIPGELSAAHPVAKTETQSRGKSHALHTSASSPGFRGHKKKKTADKQSHAFLIKSLNNVVRDRTLEVETKADDEGSLGTAFSQKDKANMGLHA